MDMIFDVLAASWAVFVESAPWMLLGFAAAGLLKAFLPEDLVARHLGGSRFKNVIKAAVLGLPLPLCSCGVVPAAAGLRNQGASKGATTAFLISTPESGVDSMAITYALLDPLMTLIRPLGALSTALAAGLAVNATDKDPGGPVLRTIEPASSGCGCGSCANPAPSTFVQRLRAGTRYAFGDLLSDIGTWFVVGVLIAGAITALVPEGFIESHAGTGIVPMVATLLLAVPMYVCATSSTPIAAALALKGLSPGAALVFLLAGPATNAASIAVVAKMLGVRATAVYLAVIILGSLALGLGADALYTALGLDVAGWVRQATTEEQGLFYYICAGLLALLLARGPILRIISRGRHSHA